MSKENPSCLSSPYVLSRDLILNRQRFPIRTFGNDKQKKYRQKKGTTNLKYYFVYIMSSRKDGVLYIGMTNDLVRRVSEHKAEYFPGFSKKYKTKTLVYYESYRDVNVAILREKRLKKWNRVWKVKLIEKNNPEWKDLYVALA